MACVDVPALPLQLLMRQHRTAGAGDWRRTPLAVVADDDPNALIEWVNAAARKKRVRVGQRYAAALSLCRELRATPIPSEAVGSAVQELTELLYGYTPRLEAEAERPGVFWLDPSGLGGLFGPLERWSASVRDAVRSSRFEATVVVGFARLPAWAIARHRRGVFVVENAAEEAELTRNVPLASLEVPPGWKVGDARRRTRVWAELRDAMLALGVDTLGRLLALPRGDVGVRFGPDARTLHALFADALRPPMDPVVPLEPLVVEADIEPPDDNHARLLFSIKGALHALMGELAERALAMSALTIELTEEPAPNETHGVVRTQRLEPATPTRDALVVLELARLRLSAVRLEGRCERLRMVAEATALDGTQLTLFGGRRRDPNAAKRGIARLRAALGDDAVTRARLVSQWAPEDAFVYERAEEVAPPERPPELPDGGVFQRRLFRQPRPLPSDPRGRPRTTPPIETMTGPYRLQNAWWTSREVARDYFYAERQDGAVLWLFRVPRGGWFLQGQVE
ncbi:MAG: DNA polymerase Y family protein [Sandaracinaceae bacterium]